MAKSTGCWGHRALACNHHQCWLNAKFLSPTVLQACFLQMRNRDGKVVKSVSSPALNAGLEGGAMGHHRSELLCSGSAAHKLYRPGASCLTF
jgi:hypothetical protein